MYVGDFLRLDYCRYPVVVKQYLPLRMTTTLAYCNSSFFLINSIHRRGSDHLLEGLTTAFLCPKFLKTDAFVPIVIGGKKTFVALILVHLSSRTTLEPTYLCQHFTKIAADLLSRMG